MYTPRITLDQWRALHAVIQYGGFAQAAVSLNRSQSSISYNIKQLQHQLGLQLLEIRGRKAILTETGHNLLVRAEHLLQQAQDLETFAASLEQGWESEIRLVVDTAFPAGILMDSLKEFSRYCPNIRVQLTEVVLSGAEEALETGKADIAIAGGASDDRLDDILMELTFSAVAHPDHQLHKLGRSVTESDLKQQTQVIIRDSGTLSNREIGWQNTGNCWSVGSIDKAIYSLIAGLGFAWMPQHAIREHLEKGQLKILDLQSGKHYRAFLYMMFGNKANPGPGTRKLAEIINRHASNYSREQHAGQAGK